MEGRRVRTVLEFDANEERGASLRALFADEILVILHETDEDLRSRLKYHALGEEAVRQLTEVRAALNEAMGRLPDEIR